MRRLLVIPDREKFIRESPPLVPQFFELRQLSNAGEQFLTNGIQTSSTRLPNVVTQGFYCFTLCTR